MAQGASHGSLPQVGSFGGLADEVQSLKRDKNVLMLELVRLRQQQQVPSLLMPWQACCSFASAGFIKPTSRPASRLAPLNSLLQVVTCGRSHLFVP